MNSATITHKGQITIPKPVRDALGLQERDKVVFAVLGGRAIMMPVRQGALERVRGVAAGRRASVGIIYSPPSRQEEREAARRQVAHHLVESVPEE